MKEGLGISQEKYLSALNIVKTGAKRFSLDIPNKSYEDWQSTFGAIRLADSAIDNIDDRTARMEQEMIEFVCGESAHLEVLNPELQESLTELRQRIVHLPEPNRNSFRRNLQLLCRVTEEIKNADNPLDLAFFTRLEGQLTSKLLITLLPETLRKSSDFRSFVHWFSYLGRFSNSFDTLVDFSRDYENGEIKVAPTFRNKCLYSKAGLGDLFPLLAETRFVLIFSLVKAAFINTKSYSTRR